MAQNNAVPEACDCAKKWVSIGLTSVNEDICWYGAKPILNSDAHTLRGRKKKGLIIDTV